MISTFLITGFLGSGKTTFLNALLPFLENEKVLIIENEVGAVNIDSTILQTAPKNIIPITGGCICCSLDTELYNVLAEIIQQEIPPSYLFIESTGIADPGSIQKLFSSPEIKEYYTLIKTIALADAGQVLQRLEDTPECGIQLVRSDHIILNKIDTLTPDAVRALLTQLKTIQPWAELDTAIYGQIALEKVIAPVIYPPWQFSPHILSFNTKSNHSINAVYFETQNAISIPAFQSVVQLYFYQYPNQLFRIKGYVLSSDLSTYSVQSVGDHIQMEKSDRTIPFTQIVFIGKNLTDSTVNRLMRPFTS
ncbi:MAG: GTP-binding protein [Cytophagaceae bacterium]|jgi:G3E family GTPase|nr:GTP-binding protein [Cytophagaceae bacterium]